MTTKTTPPGQFGELVRYFLRLGCQGFGGPVALVGQMERELVVERKWLTKEQMREAIAICQSLPGPLAIQVGIYVGYLRGGFWGAWAGGWAFILPNFVIVVALGALYVHLGDLRAITAIFYGVSPGVSALILPSCYRLAKLGMEDWLQWAIAGVCLVITVVLQAEVALLFIGAGRVGIIYYGHLRPRRGRPRRVRVDPRQSFPVLPQVRIAHLRQRPRHRAVPRAGPGASIWLARPAPVPRRRRGRDDQPRPRRHHGDLRRLSGRRILRRARLDRRDLPAVVHPRARRGAAAGQVPRQPERPRFRERCLCGRDRHDPRRLHPARPHRDRRLAHRADRPRLPRRPLSLEGQQSAADRRDRRRRPHRLSAAAAGLGDGQIARSCARR